MIVVAKQNIDSLKYGEVLKDAEIEIEDKVAESWIKQGVAYGKVKVDNSHKGDTRVEKKTKQP